MTHDAPVVIEDQLKTLVPSRYHPAIYLKDPPDEVADLAEWDGDPWALVLQGPTGTGKSWAATWVFSEWARRSLDGMRVQRFPDVLWVSYPELGATLRREMTNGSASVLEGRLQASPLLLIDDLAAGRTEEAMRGKGEAVTPYQREVLMLLLTHRYNHGRPTIVTLDRPSREFQKADPRVHRRLASGRGINCRTVKDPHLRGARR